MPGTTTGRPTSDLRTTNVLAAMSPTRRCPVLVSATTKPTRPKHGRKSTIHSNDRMSALPMPGTCPSSRTARRPTIALPGVIPVRPSSAT